LKAIFNKSSGPGCALPVHLEIDLLPFSSTDNFHILTANIDNTPHPEFL
jgi:hypothetical protein